MSLFLLGSNNKLFYNSLFCSTEIEKADMAKLVDAPDLGSGAERCKSSSLFIRTTEFW